MPVRASHTRKCGQMRRAGDELFILERLLSRTKHHRTPTRARRPPLAVRARARIKGEAQRTRNGGRTPRSGATGDASRRRHWLPGLSTSRWKAALVAPSTNDRARLPPLQQRPDAQRPPAAAWQQQWQPHCSHGGRIPPFGHAPHSAQCGGGAWLRSSHPQLGCLPHRARLPPLQQRRAFEGAAGPPRDGALRRHTA